uniref:N-lysine methyltransferase SMYD2-like n=1 Tax=Dermatophagoides pteronyssinus TaxID=6956 RepID=A0A6P6Y3L8_DERPT|nr:N-lysine methyltransferase SMYD2-like [Dermatophagoides pteronyssinus]
MFYCGKECQQKDWIRHKFECKFFRKKYEPLTHAYLQLEWIDEFFRLVLRLYLYITENPESIYEQYKLLNDEYSKNFFKIYDYRMKEIGSGLYLAESKFQHCCQPNTKLLYNGIQLVMRSIKSIRNGEQIFINNIRYCDINGQIFWSPSDKHYYFTYKCELCMNLEQIVKKFMSRNFNESYRLVKKFVKKLDKICYECNLDLILQKIFQLQLYVMIHQDDDDNVKELSLAELAKRLGIKFPNVYDKIFENVYFNQGETPMIFILKALANIEFNV